MNAPMPPRYMAAATLRMVHLAGDGPKTSADSVNRTPISMRNAATSMRPLVRERRFSEAMERVYGAEAVVATNCGLTVEHGPDRALLSAHVVLLPSGPM